MYYLTLRKAAIRAYVRNFEGNKRSRKPVFAGNMRPRKISMTLKKMIIDITNVYVYLLPLEYIQQYVSNSGLHLLNALQKILSRIKFSGAVQLRYCPKSPLYLQVGLWVTQ